MNFTNLILENFGKFEKFECNFTNGLNVIKGGNEAGKSTLVAAISALLYGNPKASDKPIIMSKTWGSQNPLVLKANISDNNFYGIVQKDFDSGKVKLDNQKLNISIDDINKISDIITGSIGFRTAELFEATSCIKQGQITHIDGSVEQIKDNLESLVTGGHEDMAVSQILAKIDNRINDITNNDEQKPCLLKKLEQTKADLEYYINRMEREVNNIKSWRSSLAQVEIAYTNGVDDYENKKHKLEAAIKAEKAQKDLDQVAKQKDDIAERLKNVKTTNQKVKELTGSLNQIIDVSLNDRNKIEDLESTIKYLRPKQRDLENEVESDQKTFDNM